MSDEDTDIITFRERLQENPKKVSKFYYRTFWNRPDYWFGPTLPMARFHLALSYCAQGLGPDLDQHASQLIGHLRSTACLHEMCLEDTTSDPMQGIHKLREYFDGGGDLDDTFSDKNTEISEENLQVITKNFTLMYQNVDNPHRYYRAMKFVWEMGRMEKDDENYVEHVIEQVQNLESQRNQHHNHNQPDTKRGVA